MMTLTQEFAESKTLRARSFQGGSIPEAVAVQAAAEPEAVAVAAGSQVLNYRELNARANQVARYLRSLGVATDVLVGLCLPRCLDMVVGALGIWKAGGSYVPLDPTYPSDRLAFMLEDAQAPVMITSPCISQRLPAVKTQLVDIRGQEIGGQPADAPGVRINPNDLAYVVYTSGSTGVPKGVEITHGSLANLAAWHQEAFSVTYSDRASHVAGLGFDAAIWELWPYLVAGASVHLVDEVTRNSAELLQGWLLATGITISFIPTPLAERLLTLEWPCNPCLRLLLTGGDMLHHYPPANLPFSLVNNYGPTECTVVATCGPVFPDLRPDTFPPIGNPIKNTDIYLLDENRRPVPAGARGEIYIGGASVARGYHNRPEMTGEKFIPNPFSTEPGSRLYKTGDLARMLPDGQFAFLGRVDDQIKIRGYRIEPNIAAFIGWFLSGFGLLGPVLITLMASLVGKAAALARMKTLLRTSMAELLPWRSIAATLSVAALAGVAAVAVKSRLQLPVFAALVTTATVYMIAYAAMVWLFNLINENEKSALTGWIKRGAAACARRLAWAA